MKMNFCRLLPLQAASLMSQLELTASMQALSLCATMGAVVVVTRVVARMDRFPCSFAAAVAAASSGASFAPPPQADIRLAPARLAMRAAILRRCAASRHEFTGGSPRVVSRCSMHGTGSKKPGAIATIAEDPLRKLRSSCYFRYGTLSG